MPLLSFNPNTLIKSAEVNANFQSVSLATRLVGGSANQVLKIVSGLPTWATVTGGINYLASNPDAEADTAGWVTYADTAKNIPANGIGGSPVSTWTRSTVAPLRGTGSFLWTKAGTANRQGEGVAFDFTIDAADAAKPLAITFDYVLSSGTFTPSNGITPPLNDNTTSTNAGNSDLEVFIYDVTNAILIPVTPQVLTSNSLVPSAFKSTFQTSSNSVLYRLIIHTATTTTNNFAMKFDNFYVGPQSVSYGPPVSDLTPFTMLITGSVSDPTKATSPAYDQAVWSRDGDCMIVRYEYGQSANTGAANGSGAYLMGLPPGYTIDSSKITINSTKSSGVVGSASVSGNSAGSGHVKAYDSTHLALLLEDAVSGVAEFWGSDYVGLTSSDVRVSFTARVPILGWSASALMSNDTDTRVVAASYSVSGATSIGIAQPCNFDYKYFDTHNAVTTGLGWKFTAPVSGIYRVSTTGLVSTTVADIAVFKNGALYIVLTDWSTTLFMSGSGLVALTAGEYIDIRSTTISQDTNPTVGFNNVHIERLTGPSVIAASEIVSLNYNDSATSVSGSLATVVFTNQVYDSHGAMTAGLVTAPRSGLYSIKSALSLSGTFAANDLSVLEIQKNGTAIARLKKYAIGGETQLDLLLDTDAQLVAGDIVRIQVSSDATTPAIVASTSENYISVKAA